MKNFHSKTKAHVAFSSPSASALLPCFIYHSLFLIAIIFSHMRNNTQMQIIVRNEVKFHCAYSVCF